VFPIYLEPFGVRYMEKEGMDNPFFIDIFIDYFQWAAGGD
jgi:hypothetical protein